MTLGLEQYSTEQIKQLSMIELTSEIMASRKEAIAFKDLIEEIGKLLELSEEELRSRMAQFYTDLNIDGRFLTLGENRWGLRSWYPYDQIEEETVQPAKPKKKGKKKAAEDDDDDLDLDLEEYDELDDEEYDDLDDVDDLDEDDDLLDDDDDDEDEDDDFDDDLLDDDLDLDADSDEDEDEEFDDLDEEDDDVL